jgi:hypothetical protein
MLSEGSKKDVLRILVPVALFVAATVVVDRQPKPAYIV